MSRTVTCPGCTRTLRVPDDTAGKQIRCPVCRLAFAAGAPDGHESSVPEAAPATPPAAAPSRPEEVWPTDVSPLKFRVTGEDPQHFLTGNFSGRALPNGVELRGGGREVVIPVGSQAVYLRYNRVRVRYGGRWLRLSVSAPLRGQDRLARGLAEFLNGERPSLRRADYRPAWYLLVPVLLPLGLPLLTLGNPFAVVVACGTSVAATALITRGYMGVLPRLLLGGVVVLVGCAFLGIGVLQGDVRLPWMDGIPGFSWEAHGPPDASYRVLIPGRCRSEDQAISSSPGSARGQALVSKWGEMEFVVGFADLPLPAGAAAAEERLDAAREGTIPVGKTRLLRESRIALGAHPGREYVFTEGSPPHTVVCRHYVVGGRLYQLLARGPGIDPDSADVRKFFDSFTVK